MYNISFITALYGSAEKMCKPILRQNTKQYLDDDTSIINCDFICFTDQIDLDANGWTLDRYPYHLDAQYNIIDDGSFNNSIKNNNHPRNIMKYYKLQFHRIPCLKLYDVIIWIDSTMIIKSENIANYMAYIIKKSNLHIFLSEHEYRYGKLNNEVEACLQAYTTSYYKNRGETPQNFKKQYDDYINDGYDDKFWKRINDSNHYGFWACGFIAFNMTINTNSTDIIELLDLWYLHVLKYTNRDQISFPYVCWKLHVIPYTFPDTYMIGNAHFENTFYRRIVNE